MLNSGVHKYASQVGNYKMQDSADYSVFKVTKKSWPIPTPERICMSRG